VVATRSGGFFLPTARHKPSVEQRTLFNIQVRRLSAAFGLLLTDLGSSRVLTFRATINGRSRRSPASAIRNKSAETPPLPIKTPPPRTWGKRGRGWLSRTCHRNAADIATARMPARFPKKDD
jgi:hypothetical protein